MAGEPPLDPPDYDDEREPTDEEFAQWKLRDMDYLVEDDDVVEACDKVLRRIGQDILDGKETPKEEIAQILIDAVEFFSREGDMCEVGEWQQAMKEKADEDFVEPDPPDDDDYPEHYDGTGRY